jgi:hypothetical protein
VDYDITWFWQSQYSDPSSNQHSSQEAGSGSFISTTSLKWWNLLLAREVGPLTTAPLAARALHYLLFSAGPHQTLPGPQPLLIAISHPDIVVACSKILRAMTVPCFLAPEYLSLK